MPHGVIWCDLYHYSSKDPYAVSKKVIDLLSIELNRELSPKVRAKGSAQSLLPSVDMLFPRVRVCTRTPHALVWSCRN